MNCECDGEQKLKENWNGKKCTNIHTSNSNNDREAPSTDNNPKTKM